MARARKRPPRRTLARRWSAVIVVAVVGYFYYHPMRAYFSTRHELQTTRSEVQQLAAERHQLAHSLSAASSTEELARQARQLGYVRPGEQLFIVKGISAWKRAHTTLQGGGK
jgi:cell division protein FtsB